MIKQELKKQEETKNPF